MEKTLLGLEIEFHLIDKEGNLKNDSDKVINDYRANEHIIKELAHSIVEVTAPPASDIEELAQNIAYNVSLASSIAKSHDMYLMPSTSIGIETPLKRDSPRYKTKETILGTEKRELEYHICGTHVHVDKMDTAEQHRMMTAIDPVFALMSSTPFFKSQNSLNDYRVKIYRNDVYSTDHGRLLPYVKSEQDLMNRAERLYDEWITLAKEKGFTDEGFSLLDTYWGPVRLREKTIESRCADTNLLSNVIALSAFYAGINRNGLVIPEFEKIKEFEKIGYVDGITNPKLNMYLRKLVDVADKGLEEHERKYLNPFKKMLITGKNFSDDITNHAKSIGIYQNGKLDDSNPIRKYIAERFMEDLNEHYNLHGQKMLRAS